MFTPDEIDALRDYAGKITEPVTEFLLKDIARRISEAGQLTSTASYQIWRAQNLGMSRKEIEKELKRLLNKSSEEIKQLLTQSAEVGYNFDISQFPQKAVPFEGNAIIQQITRAAVELAQDDFSNITQTLGMVDPYGKALPLQKAYQSACDFAFNQVITGAADYTTAINLATKNLAEKGVRYIDYESGTHTSLEAAVRRNVMGAIGLMAEQVEQHNHDDLGCDGWEITAHAASAPDHEPIQGKQYSDAEYEALNDSLTRRIGTLNCGHSAFPIILGINKPQYTEAELDKLKRSNAEGITYQGRHYTMYGATQKQRQLERTMRKQKNRIFVDEQTENADKLLNDRIRYRRIDDEYRRFSKAAGMPTQYERMEVAGFGWQQAKAANKAYNEYLKNPETHATLKAISGGRITDPEGRAANAHAARYYGLVRNMTTDVAAISKNTGFAKTDIQKIKDFIFVEKHDLGGAEEERFAPDFAMAQSWQRLISGDIKPHDLTLIRHEVLEQQLMENGMSQHQAHIETSKKYNYGEEERAYYALLKKNSD